MVTILAEDGTPTPVVWTKLLAPSTPLHGRYRPSADHGVGAGLATGWPTYAQEVDRESARELLAAKMARCHRRGDPCGSCAGRCAPAAVGERVVPPPPPPTHAPSAWRRLVVAVAPVAQGTTTATWSPTTRRAAKAAR